jgi:hypothetical protein
MITVEIARNGNQRITFEDSISFDERDMKLSTLIQGNIDDIDADSLSEEFKTNNCRYPWTAVNKDFYQGTRLTFETKFDNITWRIAKLNPMTRDMPLKLRKAVDAWILVNEADPET